MNYARLLKALFKRLNKRGAADKVRQLVLHEEVFMPKYDKAVDRFIGKPILVRALKAQEDRAVGFLTERE